MTAVKAKAGLPETREISSLSRESGIYGYFQSGLDFRSAAGDGLGRSKSYSAVLL